MTSDCPATTGIALHFDHPEYGLRIPTEMLSFGLPLSDRRAHESARRRCLEQLDARPDPARLSSVVSRTLVQHGPPFLDLEGASRVLGMSSRSLRRRLSEEGVSFRALQSDVRLALAESWLADPRRSITDIGLELGYADAANFSRAFRAARGRTPLQARTVMLDRASASRDSE